MPTPMVNTDVFGFVLDQFDAAYEQKSVALDQFVSPIMASWNTERPTETYSYLESLPYVKRWRRGEARLKSGFKSIKWTTDTFDWNVGVTWHKNDARDHQGRMGIKAKAEGAADRFAALRLQITAQVFGGQTDPDLLPAIPTAPDGAAPFAATAGGVDRFGRSGGNIVTGTGTSPTQIQDDFFSCQEATFQLLDTEGEPLWDPGIVMMGTTIMYPAALHKEMLASFRQLRPAQAITNVAGTENVGGAAVTNLVMDANVPVTLFMNPHLTDANDWYFVLTGSPVRPLYQGIQEEINHTFQDDTNSDEARNHKIHGVFKDARYSFGVGPMYQAFRVSNT